MTWRIELGHNFEAAHRLSTEASPIKCQSIHGHSWWVRATIEGDGIDPDGILVEFGAFKKAFRGWLDDNLDHALLLAEGDPVVDALRAVVPDMRLFVLPANPTTEVIARVIFEVAERLLRDVLKVDPQWAWISEVHVQETRVNAASYRAHKRADLTSPMIERR